MSAHLQTWDARIRKGRDVSTVTVVGASLAEARRSASRIGTVVSVNKTKSSKLKLGMDRNERFVFLMRMATMLGSRLPVSQALQLMIESFTGRIREAARNALPHVERGVPLGDALAMDVRNFPGSVGLLIKTGSAAGNTAQALKEAAEFERMIGDASKGALMSILQSFGYQFAALGLLVVNQYVVVPQMFDSPVMKMAEGADFSFWENIGFYFMMAQVAIISFLMFLVFLATIGRRLAPDKIDNIIIKMPLMRDIVISQDNFIGLYRLSLLINAGVPMNEAVQSCYEASRPGALREDFKRAMYAIRRGEKWPKYMTTLHATDRAALLLMPDADELAKNLNLISEQSKAIYLQRLAVISPIMNVTAAITMSIAGFIILIVTTIPQLELVSEVMK